REVKSVLRTARVHEAAEQFVGRVVDVLGERVVRAEVHALGEAALEIDRHAMVRVGPGGGKRRYESKEAVGGKRTAVSDRVDRCRGAEGLEAGECARRRRDGSRHIGCAEERGKGRDSATGNIRVKRGN